MKYEIKTKEKKTTLHFNLMWFLSNNGWTTESNQILVYFNATRARAFIFILRVK